MASNENINIVVPNSLDWKSALNFRITLRAIVSATNYNFDFSHLGHVEPFGMILVAESIRKFMSAHPFSNFKAIGCKNGYPAHMGFYKACGFDFGNSPGQAIGSDSYLPITKVPVDLIKQNASEKSVEVGDEIEAYAKTQAELLTRSNNSELFKTVSYSLRELIRNVVEHSESKGLYFCAQYWPSRNQAELAILDSGIGVFASITQNPTHAPVTHKDAIKLAVLPGVTRSIKSSNHYDAWANSGYGLYMTSRICQEGGQFLLASGDSALELNGSNRIYHETVLNGTAVRLFINTDRNEKTQAMLTRFRTEGTEIATKMKCANLNKNESASMMLDVYTKRKR